jgi:hypothetical protein
VLTLPDSQAASAASRSSDALREQADSRDGRTSEWLNVVHVDRLLAYA